MKEVVRGSFEGLALCGPLNFQRISLDDPPPSHLEVEMEGEPGWVHTYEALDVDRDRMRITYRYTGRWSPLDPAKPIPSIPRQDEQDFPLSRT